MPGITEGSELLQSPDTGARCWVWAWPHAAMPSGAQANVHTLDKDG